MSDTFRDPPAGSSFGVSPEDLLTKAAGWDVNEEPKIETQRLLDKLAEALSKERRDRSTAATIIATNNRMMGVLDAQRELDKVRIEALESDLQIAADKLRRLSESLRAISRFEFVYRAARVADTMAQAIVRRVRR